MTITALTDPNELPNQSQSQQEFDTKMANMIANYPLRAQQENALAAAMSAYAAGGAYAFQYAFDAATVDADPGAGKMRLGSSTQNTSTVLRIDNVMSGGLDLSAVWTELLSVTSSVKGSLRIVKSTDPSKWMIVDVTGSAAVTGYRNLTTSVRASSESSPFANGDPLMVYLQRSGDKGDTGNAAAFPYMKVSDTKALGLAGGSSVAGYQDRSLNSVDSNGIAGASLASSTVTLPAGTYEVFAIAQAYAVGSHQIRLMNATDGVVLVAGLSSFAPSGSAAAQTSAILEGRFVLAATKGLRLSHYTQSAQSSIGLGNALDANATSPAPFAQITIRKVA